VRIHLFCISGREEFLGILGSEITLQEVKGGDTSKLKRMYTQNPGAPQILCHSSMTLVKHSPSRTQTELYKVFGGLSGFETLVLGPQAISGRIHEYTNT